MPSAAFAEIRADVRTAFRENLGTLWTDDWLDFLVDEAQREWGLLTGEFTGEASVTSGDGGVFALPSDYYAPVALVVDGWALAPLSWRYAQKMLGRDFRTAKGVASGVIYDFDSWGTARVFPCEPGVSGKLEYRRFPARGVLETRASSALEAHVLYQMNLMSGKDAWAGYWTAFQKAVWEFRRGVRTVNGRTGLGVYY